MNKEVKNEIKVCISPNKEEMAMIRSQFEAATGSTDYYEDRSLFDALYRIKSHRFNLNDMTMDEANEKVELLRILLPEQNVTLYANDGDFIGHTTWNDQMKMFFEYPTYTPLGTMIAKARQIVAKKEGVLASDC